MDHQESLDKEIKLEPLENEWSIDDEGIKIEPTETTWIDQEIKLEPPEAVKEKLLDSPPKLERMDEPSELTESKIEEPESSETVRLSDLEYPDYLKLEPVEEPDGSSRRILHSSFSSPPERAPIKRKCSVCSGYISLKSLTEMIHKDRRSVFMVGLVLSGRKTVREAEGLMAIRTLFFTCRSHVSESIQAIFNALKIKSVQELETRSTESMEELICTLYSIVHRWMAPARFKNLLLEIFYRINPLSKDIEKPVQQSALASESIKEGTSEKHPCSVCSTVQNSDRLAHIENGNELVLAVGFVLAEKKSLEEAKLLLPPMKICKIHLSEAVNSIFILLKILNMGELETCSIVNRQTLMSIVMAVNEDCDFVQFGKLLESFIRKMDPHFIPAYIGNMRRNTKNLKCPICWCLLEKTDKFVVIEEENRKLVLLVGSLLGGRNTIAEARFAMTVLNYSVCRIHLSEAVNEISKFLDINEPNKMQTCPTDRMTYFMNIVNKLSPGLQDTHFNNFLLDFVLKIDE